MRFINISNGGIDPTGGIRYLAQRYECYVIHEGQCRGHIRAVVCLLKSERAYVVAERHSGSSARSKAVARQFLSRLTTHFARHGEDWVYSQTLPDSVLHPGPSILAEPDNSSIEA